MGKLLNNFELLLVTSKTMGAELKEHYALIFEIFFFFLAKKGSFHLSLYSVFYFFPHTCYNGFSVTWALPFLLIHLLKKNVKNLPDWIDTLICKVRLYALITLGFHHNRSHLYSQVAKGWPRKHTSLNPDWLNWHNIIMNPSLTKANLVLLSSTGGLIVPS